MPTKIFPTRSKVEQINSREIDKLSGDIHTFELKKLSDLSDKKQYYTLEEKEQEWIEKILLLINPPIENDVEVEKTALTKATSEKPLNTRRRLATTRRQGKPIIVNKKKLSKTRRNR